MIFRKIKDYLFPPLDEPPVLSEGKRNRLEALLREEGFAVYLELLDKEVQVYAEQLTSGQASTEQIHHLLGVIRGLREGPKLIQRILTTGAQYDEYRKRVTERANAGDDAIRAASFGTPFWQQ